MSKQSCAYCGKSVYFPGRRDEEITEIVVCLDCEPIHERKQNVIVSCSICKKQKRVGELTFGICCQCIDEYSQCIECGDELISVWSNAANDLFKGVVKPECIECKYKVFVCKETTCNAPSWYKNSGIDGYCQYHSKCHQCSNSLKENNGKWKHGTDSPTIERNFLCRYCAS